MLCLKEVSNCCTLIAFSRLFTECSCKQKLENFEKNFFYMKNLRKRESPNKIILKQFWLLNDLITSNTKTE